MKESLSFHDILDSKLHSRADFPSEKWTEDAISGVEPKHLSTIFALMSDKILSGPKPTIPKAYQRAPRTAATEKLALPLMFKENRTKEPQKKAFKPRIPGPKHQLSPSQKLSFDFFQNSGKSLMEDFNREELQLAYRQLALQFHPDRQGGSSKHFIDLKFHYEVLKTLFK